ncbi:MAG TPA: exosome complex protein Rrp42 [Candidatus Nanoarchaeia archaeon]|nr:exosome complex protein Rrp42 [Candidatus Nanoarchaeia archaeon]
MKNSIKEHLFNLYGKGMHIDGRRLDEYREISIEYGISAKSAEGSARVKIGKTEVIVGIKLDLGEPFPDRPNEGSIIVNTELRPICSWKYESGPPGTDSIELSRVVDRAIREAHYLDFKKLCITPGEKIWMVFIDIYPLNDDGNLFDASALAALAALMDTKMPALIDGVIDYKQKTDKGLPLKKDIPVSCTIVYCDGYMIIDPTTEEEQFIDARLTIGFLDNGNICALQKGGDVGLSEEELMKIVELAERKTIELRKYLK